MSGPVKSPEDLEIYVGDDFSYPVQFFTDVAMTTPEVISGRTYAAQVRKSAKSATVLASFTCTLTDTNEVTLSLGDDVTAALAPGTGVADLQESNGGVVTTLVIWDVVITQDVTRVIG